MIIILMTLIFAGNTTHHCGNYNFIVRSVEEIERLWSQAGTYLDSNRNNTTLVMLKVLVFLCCNWEFQNKRTIGRALKIAKDNSINVQASGLVVEDDAYAGKHSLNKHSAQKEEQNVSLLV